MLKSHWASLPIAALLVGATADDTIHEINGKSAENEISTTGEFELFQHGNWQRNSPTSDTRGRDFPPKVLPTKFNHPRSSYREKVYEADIREAELRYGIPIGLLQALIWQESRFNPMAVSPAGAAGLAQLMPKTALYLGVKNRHDPAASIDGGARYLKEMLGKFEAIHLALAAYNAGPGAVERAKGIPQNRETPGYVHNIISRWKAITR